MIETRLKGRASCLLPGAAKWVLLFAVLMPERGVQVQGLFGQTCDTSGTRVDDTSGTYVSCHNQGLTAVPALINPDATHV